MRRRAILVPLGTLALIFAGVAGAEIVSETRGHQDRATAPAAATATPSTSLPPGFGGSLAERSGVSVPRERAATALCKTQPDAVRSLQGLSTKAPATVEMLRDGLPVLEERLSEVQLAAEGRPDLTPVVKRLTAIRSLWRSAVAADDDGKPGDAAKALAAADKELDTLSADLRKAFPGSAKDCAAVPAKK